VIQSSQSAWGSPSNPKVAPAKPSLFSIVGSGGADELHSAPNGLQNLGTKLSPVSTHFLTSKGATSEVFQRGMYFGFLELDGIEYAIRVMPTLQATTRTSRSQFWESLPLYITV